MLLLTLYLCMLYIFVFFFLYLMVNKVDYKDSILHLHSLARATFVSIETRVRYIDWWQIWRPRSYFSEEQNPTTDISHTFCRSATKFCIFGGLANRNLFSEFRELWSRGPATPCGDMHQSFTDALVKWFFDNFPMFAGSFSVVSIHCLARELGTSFLYKCPALRGWSLRQHGLLVIFFPSTDFSTFLDGFLRKFSTRCGMFWNWLCPLGVHTYPLKINGR